MRVDGRRCVCKVLVISNRICSKDCTRIGMLRSGFRVGDERLEMGG